MGPGAALLLCGRARRRPHDILYHLSQAESWYATCPSSTSPWLLTFIAAQSANLEPWFGPHLQRNIYLSLLHIEPENASEKSPKIPDSILRAALLRRAVEDIHRIVQIRAAKAACSTLLQRGSVGDDLWQRFSRAEKEMEEELRDVVMEVRRRAA